MYLPRQEVIGLFGRLASTLTDSEIVFETVAEKYTRGLRQKMVTAKMRRNLGTKDVVSFTYGVRTAREIETYTDGIQVLQEWSYLEEPDVRPGFMRIFRHVRSFTRSQWTIRASLGRKAGYGQS
jgi:O-methyltransferase involved in polyketide biosynthesis